MVERGFIQGKENPERTQEMKTLLDDISGKLFGRSLSEGLEKKICLSCGTPVENFRDEVSAREYQISGMCQACQDEVFKEE